MGRLSSKWTLLAAVFAAILCVDQVTKYLAVANLTTVFQQRGARSLGERVAGFYGFKDLEPYRTAPVPLVQEFWHWKYVENPGAAWGAFQGMDERYRGWFFAVISVGAAAFILAYYRKLEARARYLQLALALVLGGAIGNFVDRLARRYVIDFVDWHWRQDPGLHWPTFNVADSAIVVGVAMMILEPRKKKQAPAAASAVTPAAGTAGRGDGATPGV